MESAGLRRPSLFALCCLGEQVSGGSLRFRRGFVAEQEVDRSFSSGREQHSLAGRLVVSPAAYNAEVRSKPHRVRRQSKEPHECPQQHTGNTADGDERH